LTNHCGIASKPPNNKNRRNVKRMADAAAIAISLHGMLLGEESASDRYRHPKRHGVSFRDVEAPNETAARIRRTARSDLYHEMNTHTSANAQPIGFPRRTVHMQAGEKASASAVTVRTFVRESFRTRSKIPRNCIMNRDMRSVASPFVSSHPQPMSFTTAFKA
jgi:hypothetical protein